MFNTEVIAFVLFLFVLHIAGSSPSPMLSPSPSPLPSLSYISIGSSISISPNQTNGWISPSGNFAFGFYALCDKCNRYRVGIWIKKPIPIVVWSANFSDDGPPIRKSASILLNHDGVLVLLRPGTNPKQLLSNQLQEASRAVMHDTGNFALYNSSFQVVWQSFDHPTDTLLPGQTLISGHSLLSNNSKYKLKFRKHNLLLKRASWYHGGIWESRRFKRGRPFSLSLDSTGRLFIVNKDGAVVQNMTGNSGIVGNTIYRANLGSDGVFRLYVEMMGLDGGRTFEVWCTYCSVCRKHNHWIIGTAIVVLALVYVFYGRRRKPSQ